jgi:hypothetical protein
MNRTTNGNGHRIYVHLGPFGRIPVSEPYPTRAQALGVLLMVPAALKHEFELAVYESLKGEK